MTILIGKIRTGCQLSRQMRRNTVWYKHLFYSQSPFRRSTCFSTIIYLLLFSIINYSLSRVLRIKKGLLQKLFQERGDTSEILMVAEK